MITAHMNIKKKDFTQEPKLLSHPNIPNELQGVAPRVILGNLWWDRTKKQIRRSTDYHCKACGRHRSEDAFHNWIECHEVYWLDYKKSLAQFDRVVPLCHTCHSFIHSGRLIALYEEGEMTKEKMQIVLQHGFAICGQFGVRPFYTSVEAALMVDMFDGNTVKLPKTWKPERSKRTRKRWHLDIFGTLFNAEDLK